MTTDPIRTIICDDNELVVLGIQTVLTSAGFDVVGSANDGQEAIELVESLHPGLVVMDLLMPGIDGIQATHAIKARWPEVKVLVITSASDEKMVQAALASGADGYCLKDSATKQTAIAAHALVSGGMWIDREIARMVLASSADAVNARPASGALNYKLSTREMEVLELLVQGFTNQDIAKKLGLGSETIKTHMRHIMEKLRVADRTQAAVKALREGLVNPKVQKQAPPP
jgi:NarL family two-component system response regulator LiaR